MRPTEIRLAQHIGRHFQAHWIIMSKRKIPILNAVKLVENKGIPIVEPENFLTPPIKYEPFEYSVIEPKFEVPENDPCFIFTNNFKPIESLKQSQLITNSIVKNDLPSQIVNRVKEISIDEEKSLKECILYSMALDSQQKKLPRWIDVHNRPGIKLPRSYGLLNARKNATLNYKLHILLVKSDIREPRGFIEDIHSNATLMHSGSLIRMSHVARFALCTEKPLSPFATKDEVLATSDEVLPDIYPFSPFINCWQRTKYEKDVDGFGIRKSAPHTIFVHNNEFRLRDTPETFYGRTLLNAFAHAAAYAKDIYKDLEGDLPSPITLQIVHTTGRQFHMGVFQLNTLKMDGAVKNIFWHQPWESLYDSCEFNLGFPQLLGFNPKPFSILKSFYAS